MVEEPTSSADATGANRFAVPLEEVERGVRVPVAEQVTELAPPPADPPIAPEELDRQNLLGITGAGRLRL